MFERICDVCAAWDAQDCRWRGCVRDRLLWALLGGEGVRGRETLGLQHRDWHAGCGDAAFIEVVPRDHPHGVRVKGGGYRKLYVSAQLDSLYGEYVWQLCEAGGDLAAADLDEACVFVNLSREPRFAPWRVRSPSMISCGGCGGCGGNWPGKSRRAGRRTGSGTSRASALQRRGVASMQHSVSGARTTVRAIQQARSRRR